MNMKMATSTFFQEKEKNSDSMGDPIPLKDGEYLDGASSSDVLSDDSDFFEEEEEEVNSSSSSSSSIFSSIKGSKDSLHDMSSLLQVLPLKRGLSKHYNGKSQSFNCLSNLRCFEDLAKPENPYNKKLKSCKSYQDFDVDDEEQQNHGSNILQSGEEGRRNSKLLNYKKTSSRRGSCSSLCTKRNVSFIKPPIPIPIPPPPPHKSSTYLL